MNANIIFTTLPKSQTLSDLQAFSVLLVEMHTENVTVKLASNPYMCYSSTSSLLGSAVVTLGSHKYAILIAL
jgi:hypothetical protein